MIGSHLNKNYPVLPSPEQILYGLILAQILEFTESGYDVENYIGLISVYAKVWKEIFAIVKG